MFLMVRMIKVSGILTRLEETGIFWGRMATREYMVEQAQMYICDISI